MVATDEAGAVVWEGGFEPFGTDYQAGTAAGASENGIYLRLPGQWDDGTWDEASSGAGVYYNVHRFLAPGVGRYTRPDPIGLAGGMNPYVYGDNQPTMKIDPFGRQARGDAHIPTPEEIERDRQRSCARIAFHRNYGDMRAANWKKSDKYFHCKANCEAVRCGGEPGYEQACLMSDLRELFDQLIKRDPPSASRADQAANRHGREQARKQPSASCQIICARYRPKGLPPRY